MSWMWKDERTVTNLKSRIGEGRREGEIFLGHILAHRLSERDSLVTCRSVAILFDTCLPTLELPEWSDIFDNMAQQDESGCN